MCFDVVFVHENLRTCLFACASNSYLCLHYIHNVLGIYPHYIITDGDLFSCHLPSLTDPAPLRRPPVIDPEILTNMKMSQFVGHAPKPPYILRNQVPYDLDKDSGKEVPESPMMRGEGEREGRGGGSQHQIVPLVLHREQPSDAHSKAVQTSGDQILQTRLVASWQQCGSQWWS